MFLSFSEKTCMSTYISLYFSEKIMYNGHLLGYILRVLKDDR